MVIGCTEFPSKPEVKPGWLPPNKQLLKQPIDLNQCLDKNQQLFTRKINVINGIGVVLHPNVLSVRTQSWDEVLRKDSKVSSSELSPTEVGISVVPYIVDDSGQKFMLVPAPENFNKFLPTCESGWQGFSDAYFKTPYQYPTVVLTVTPEQRENLVTFLQEKRQSDCSFGEFTTKPVGLSQEADPIVYMNDVLQKVLGNEQAVFLEAFAQAQEVVLADANVKFAVSHSAVAEVPSPSATDEPPSPLKPEVVMPPAPVTTPIQGPLPPNTVQIHLVWPKSLGKLTIEGCQELEEQNQDYQTLCLFTAGNTYHISKPQKPKNSVQVTLTWQEDLGLLSIPTCQTPTAVEVGYSAPCSFKTGKTYRIAPPLANQDSAVKGEVKLIVVSLSAAMNSNETGEIIQNTLYNLLNELRETKPSVPAFTILTIGAGRQLSQPILHSEQLSILTKNEQEDELKEKIRQLQFSANDLNALDDLELVDAYLPQEANGIEGILYLTDNMGIFDTPPRKQLGVPLAWHKDGISLTVITTQGCAVWGNRANARCINWQDNKPETLESLLKDFVNQ
jgi:hypothetical protein